MPNTARNALINAGRKRVEAAVGATIIWPTPGGAVYPCSTGPLSNARRMNDGGGGFQLFDDVIAVMRTELFTATRPAEQDAVDLSVGMGEQYRRMRIAVVDTNPGAGTITLRLNSIAQAA